jgi:hypothetical protein
MIEQATNRDLAAAHLEEDQQATLYFMQELSQAPN